MAPPYSSTAAGWDVKISEMSKALIIGGTGLLGRGVATVLLNEGWDVTLLSRGQKVLPDSLTQCPLITCDREQPGMLQQVCEGLSFDLVVDCAAYSRSDAEEAYEAFNDKAGHYWFISSDFVYEADPHARYPLSESATTQTRLPYAADKLEAEAFLLEMANKHAFPVTILRPPHILGAGRPAGCDPAAGGRDNKLLERIRNGEELPLLAGGIYLLQPVWSQEIGACVHQLYRQPDVIGDIFNIAGQECISIQEYYQMIADVEQLTLKVKTVSPEAYRQEFPKNTHILRHRIYDTHKLQKAGFSPTLSLRDALIDTLLPKS